MDGERGHATMTYTIPPKKMLIINILDILNKYSDEAHRLSAKEIGERLARDYMQKVDRKAIKRNLMNLIDFGYEIEYSETTRTNKAGEEEAVYSDWYIKREFTDAELRFLVDSLLFSKTVPYHQCKAMIRKLEGLSSSYFEAKVRHIRNMPENPPENKQVFWTIEILDEAIEKSKQVSFQYVEYGPDKKARPRKSKDGSRIEEYIVSPYQMAATNGRYYLICHRTGFPRVSNYRVDRIMNIQLLDDPITPLKTLAGHANGLDLPSHMAEHVYMFAGKSVNVTFYAGKSLTSDIMDWFGRDVKITAMDDDTIMVIVKVNENAMFCWALQYGLAVEVRKPDNLRARLAEAAKVLAEKYADV
jgi:predicted DNA-binding transcriptional regulator YafY